MVDRTHGWQNTWVCKGEEGIHLLCAVAGGHRRALFMHCLRGEENWEHIGGALRYTQNTVYGTEPVRAQQSVLSSSRSSSSN